METKVVPIDPAIAACKPLERIVALRQMDAESSKPHQRFSSLYLGEV
jgi:hypothetical protein